jgi:cobalt-zinc-cadmium efflux system membrane fusion protein
MCPKGHGLPRDFCVQCGTNPAASAVPGEVPDVKLASAEMARDIGLETAPATTEKRAPTLRANAEAAYDARRYAEVRPRVSGFLSEVKADLGAAVRKGEVLAVVDSAEVGAAKARYLSARATVELAQATYARTKGLAATGSVAARQELETRTALSEAQATLREAAQRLKNLRFDDAALAGLSQSQDTSSLLEITAPIAGTVVALEAVPGEAVEPTTQIYALADTRSMWLWIDVYEADIDAVKAGQAVTFTISGANPDATGRAFAGKVTWVGTEVDPTTRTTRVRAELANPDGRLRAHQFGRAEVRLGDEHDAVVVPRGAVQRRYQDHLDFVALDDGTYHPQRVRVRPAARGDRLEVAAGLSAGQRVVTTGAFFLKTETMKDALGAGCTDD